MEAKPTYQEQLAWLDMVELIYSEDPEMVKAIKENVIAVRNYEKAIENELEPIIRKDIEQAFNDLVELGEAMVQKPPFDQVHINWMKFKQHLDYVEQQNPEVPFVFRADELNPREELVIDNRLKQLQGELRFELSRKKQFRSQQAIDHCHKSISNLKKWRD